MCVCVFNRAICVGSDVLGHLDISSRTSHGNPAEEGWTCSCRRGRPHDLIDPEFDQHPVAIVVLEELDAGLAIWLCCCFFPVAIFRYCSQKLPNRHEMWRNVSRVLDETTQLITGFPLQVLLFSF